MGAVDALSQEFAREHSDRLWRQLMSTPGAAEEGSGRRRREMVVAFALAVAAAVLVKLPVMFGYLLESHQAFYARNASLAVFPLVAAYFAWKRELPGGRPGRSPRPSCSRRSWSTSTRSRPGATPSCWRCCTSHRPLDRGGRRVRRWALVRRGRRMDFVRFTGELFIYFVLMALGGGVLTGFTLGIFASIGADAGWFVQGWLLPCGAAGACSSRRGSSRRSRASSRTWRRCWGGSSRRSSPRCS